MNKILIMSIVAIMIFTVSPSAYADNMAKARNEVQQDLISPIQMSGNDRICLDGTSPEGKFKVDYWVDFECMYCKVVDIVQFQQANKDVCVVIRHTPSIGSNSMPKALSYEALLKVNASAANNFWHETYPEGGISKPYQRALLNALDSIVLPIEQFETLVDYATPIVENDNKYSEGILSYTPTFVIEGIRFTACDFNANQLEQVIPIAKKARKGDKEAIEKIVTIVTNGLNSEPLL